MLLGLAYISLVNKIIFFVQFKNSMNKKDNIWHLVLIFIYKLIGNSAINISALFQSMFSFMDLTQGSL